MKPAFYVSTPIYYVNDVPHIGHIYTTVVGDVIARYKRLMGFDVFYLTGTDEHGQNIEDVAREKGRTPQAHADEVVVRFREWWRRLNIAHDDFIRTTEPRHQSVVTAMWRRLEAAGDIYLGHYEGLYCKRCEAFYTEGQLDAGNVCPLHKSVVERVKEPSYFFRLSKYQERLLEHYAANPHFVQPEMRQNEVVSFVRSGLRDLSVSRTTFKWGVPVPGDEKHVIYVWIDALTNYVSALGGPGAPAFEKFWPADCHLIGKDILRFHAVYWPCLLMSAGLPLPKAVVAHGWWLREAAKMSKSIGNVVRPDYLVDDFGADPLRYFLIREMTFGQDSSYSDEAFVNRYVSDLANDLGNTLSRATAMSATYFGGKTPPLSCGDNAVQDAWASLRGEWERAMERYALQRAQEILWEFLAVINQYIVTREPWKVFKEEGAASEKLARIIYNALEGLRLLALALSPVIPEASGRMLRRLGVPESPASKADLEWLRLGVGQPLGAPETLFPRVDAQEYLKTLVNHHSKENLSMPETPESNAIPGAAVAGPAPAAGTEPLAPAVEAARISIGDFAKIELRVAEILAAEPVPKSKRLMKLRVSLGDGERTIVAGIATRYTADTLVGRKVVVVANLEPAKLMGVESQGMVLAASIDGEASLVAVDAAVPPGTKVK